MERIHKMLSLKQKKQQEAYYDGKNSSLSGVPPEKKENVQATVKNTSK